MTEMLFPEVVDFKRRCFKSFKSADVTFPSDVPKDFLSKQEVQKQSLNITKQ